MLRNLADCLETLEDAGARFYTITGPGTSISFAPEEEGAATPEAALLRFEKDFQKLGPGRYTVAHKKTANDTRSKAAFSFFKSAEGAVSGIGADPMGSQVATLQMEMMAQRHADEIKWLKREHADEIKELKKKAEQPDGTDKLINAVGQINQLLQHTRTQPTPAVAGTSSTPTVPVDEQSAIVNDTVQALHEALGQDEARTLDVLRKIANVARTNPAQINNIVSFL